MSLPPPSLLITDDDQDFRLTLREVFEPRGFNTLLAANGEEALEIVHQHRVHLLLLDMHMPKLTGIETIRRVKKLDRQLPCILISGGLTEPLVEEARQAEAYQVLSKPVKFKEITAIVKQALTTTYNWSFD